MQPLRILERSLRNLASPDAYLFSVAELSALLPHSSPKAFKMILTRAVQTGVLVRACRGIYLLAQPRFATGFELFHIAAKLRAGYFNYISRESALSELGLISQVPLQYASISSSGSGGVVDCGEFGRIEFTHTKKDPVSLAPFLHYDPQRRMMCADASLAASELRSSGRNLHLLNDEAPHGHAI